MLRHQKQARAQLHKLADAGVLALALWLAHFVRANWLNNPSIWKFIEIFGGTEGIRPFWDYAWLLLAIVPIGPFILELQGFYNRPFLATRRLIAWQLFKGCLLTSLALVLVIYLAREGDIARGVLVLFAATSFGLMMLKEELIRSWIQTNLGSEQLKRRLILVGTREDTERLENELLERTPYPVEILARLDLNDTSVEDLLEVIHATSANGVVVSAKHTFFGQVEKAILACELEGVEAWLLADFFKTQVSQTMLDDFYGRPMLVFRSTPAESWQNMAKQFVDVVGAAILLVALSPFLAAVAIAIRVTSPGGPVLFRQMRSGLNGRPFTMLKFRSMVTNAEQLKNELAALNEMSGPVFKVTNDPRVTPVGRFLRRYSIDELPQLLNVFRGEMSLVGPRPLPVDEVKRFDDLSHRRRLSVKPGLTCLWQISGRNDVCDFRDWVRLDLEYIDNWSLWLDLKILLRTIPVVFWGTGAK